jgi:hypothetical protein
VTVKVAVSKAFPIQYLANSSAAIEATEGVSGNRGWEADSLSQFARLMRDIRNYGVHP